RNDYADCSLCENVVAHSIKEEVDRIFRFRTAEDHEIHVSKKTTVSSGYFLNISEVAHVALVGEVRHGAKAPFAREESRYDQKIILDVLEDFGADNRVMVELSVDLGSAGVVDHEMSPRDRLSGQIDRRGTEVETDVGFDPLLEEESRKLAGSTANFEDP